MNAAILFSHCLLNQNIIPDRLRFNPSELIDVVLERGVAIVQMPQLEFERQSWSKFEPGFELECKNAACEIVSQIKSHIKENVQVLAILGFDSSPLCGVKRAWRGHHSVRKKGVFIKELESVLHNERLQIPIIGIDPLNPTDSLRRVRLLLNYA